MKKPVVVTQHDSAYFPTYYSTGGKYGFTCPHCHKFLWGFVGKWRAEEGLLSHYDSCESFSARFVTDTDEIRGVPVWEETSRHYVTPRSHDIYGIRDDR